MRRSSIATPGSGMLSEPVAIRIAAGLDLLDRRRARPVPGAAMRAVPFSQSTLFLRNRNSTPRVSVVDDLVLARHHRREVEPDLADLDAVLGETRAAPRRSSRTIAAAPSTGCSRR